MRGLSTASLKNFVKRLYRGLPLIRDLRLIDSRLKAVAAAIDRAAAAEMIEFLHFRGPCDVRYGDPKRLLRYAFHTFSQNGEDGMLAEICRRIGAPARNFVEIGVGDGLENNTTFLLAQGWHGWWLEANQRAVQKIKRTFHSEIAAGALKVLCDAVSSENASALLTKLGVPKEFDVLSLDIDRNTYWVWRALRDYKPRIVVTEYNAIFPPDVDWKVEYNPAKRWNGSSYFGASLKAYEILGAELGYALVGCDFTGLNAFFVRRDLCGDKFAAPFTAENHYEPARYMFGLAMRNGQWRFRPAFND